MMTVTSKPILERINWLYDLARRHSEYFSSPEAQLARTRYLAQHPTAIAAMKCMDGRLNLSVVTRTPPGIIQPFRNLGGQFDLGWPHLGELLTAYVLGMAGKGRQVLILITYHFSKGDFHRGCAGFGYDTAAAMAHAYDIKRQITHTFGGDHATVYPLVCGLETDEDAMIVHGAGSNRLAVGDLGEADKDSLDARLVDLCPDMPARIREDFLPLLRGNLDYVLRLREEARMTAPRILDIQHCEWMICLGRGFDFLHTPNLALIIGPYSPNLDDPIRKAAGIIENNMKERRIPADGFLLLTSAPYTDLGVDRARAELKSRFLSGFAADVIRQGFPGLAGGMHVHTAVLDWRSRGLERL
jgi:hypothetical protein